MPANTVSITPTKIEETSLFKALQKKDSGDIWTSKIKDFAKEAESILESIIAGPFRSFTLHNPTHSRKLVHLASYLIPTKTLNSLSGLEITLIIYACYLHDMGLSLSEDERNRLLADTEFINFFESDRDLWAKYCLANSTATSTQDSHEKMRATYYAFQLQEVALLRFLRPKHASKQIYESLLGKIERFAKRADLFSQSGISFKEQLILICESHNLDASDLQLIGRDGPKYARDLIICGNKLNIQFCSAVLRIVDILDFDFERTPAVLFDNLSISDTSIPGREISISEWKKHMAVHSISFLDEEVSFHVQSNHPAIEKTVRDFCQIIEDELRNTKLALGSNSSDVLAAYTLEIPTRVHPRITSMGYSYKDLFIRLEQSKVMDILMGDQLYNDKLSAVRELVQNSVDACLARQQVETDLQYVPKVKVSTVASADGVWLEVTDNGIGMDDFVINNYLLKVGSSYYSSSEFSRSLSQTKNKIITARFGIGFVSIFMLGDLFEIYTRRFKSPRMDEKKRRLLIEGKNSIVAVFEDQATNGEFGTTVRIKMNQREFSDLGTLEARLKNYFQENIVRPRVPVEIHLTGKSESFRLTKDKYISLRDDAMTYLDKNEIVPIIIDLERWSTKLKGYVYIFLCRQESGLFHHKSKNAYLKMGSEPLSHVKLFKGYFGSRLTVNGFKMALSKVSRLLVRGKSLRIPLLIDCDVTDDSLAKYSVSREKVLGAGKTDVRQEISAAVLKYFRQDEISKTIHPETLDFLFKSSASLEPSKRYVFTVDDLKIAEDALKGIEYGKNVHLTLAAKLQISNGRAYRMIEALRAKEVVKK